MKKTRDEVESLPSFTQRSRQQADFIGRGLRSRDAAGRTGDYVDADTALQRLQGKLDSARMRNAASR